jgi:hypothetical protein
MLAAAAVPAGTAVNRTASAKAGSRNQMAGIFVTCPGWQAGEHLACCMNTASKLHLVVLQYLMRRPQACLRYHVVDYCRAQ